MSSRACLHAVCVLAELSVDHVGQPPLEASHRFFAALSVGSFPQVVGPAGGIVNSEVSPLSPARLWVGDVVESRQNSMSSTMGVI
jgi:hypothetical protein